MCSGIWAENKGLFRRTDHVKTNTTIHRDSGCTRRLLPRSRGRTCPYLCILGVEEVECASAFCIGYLLAALAKNICRAQSKLLRAMLYYITIAFLLLDPLYLSVLCGFFGGGDMNGIALFCPEWAARCLFGVLLLGNGLVSWKRVLPAYQQSFSGQ